MSGLRQSQHSFLLRWCLLLLAVFCGDVSELVAQNRYNPNQPDFYTRPKVRNMVPAIRSTGAVARATIASRRFSSLARI